MRPETPERYLYGIDASDRITFVSPEWLHFAETNEAVEVREAIVPRRLFNYAPVPRLEETMYPACRGVIV
jgi:hypothetical protein